MPSVIFVQPDGAQSSHCAAVGDSVMDCAVDNGVAGIAAQCGGGCTCSTCHCYLPSPWFDKVGAPVGDEKDILEYVPEYQSNSRLSCQIVLTDDLDGIVVEIVVPEVAADATV